MTNTWSILPAPTQEGQVGGHEGVGTIVKLGPGAEASNVKVGDRVGIKWISGACGSCRMFLPFDLSVDSSLLFIRNTALDSTANV